MILLFLLLIISSNIANYYIQSGFGSYFNLSSEFIFIVSKINIVFTSFFIFLILLKILNSSLKKFFDKILSKTTLGKKLFPLFSNGLFVLLLVVYVFFLLSFLGININTLLAGVGASSLILAFASKELISNLIGSLSLIFNKSFDIDDNIKVKGFEGKVEEITLSYTKLIDKIGNIVYIPNKNILTAEIENLSKGKEKIVEFKFNGNYSKENILKLKNFLEINSKKFDIKDYKISIGSESDKDGLYVLNIILIFERKKFNEENKREIYFELKNHL